MCTMSAVVSGTGSSLPERVMTNFDLEKMVDTSDEWITTRTGIKERRIAREDEYLSPFFKEQTGAYLSAYLEHVRMEKAVAMLATDTAPVYSVAAAVGYGSVNAFCRAFKRVSGLSPGEYRKVNSVS